MFIDMMGRVENERFTSPPIDRYFNLVFMNAANYSRLSRAATNAPNTNPWGAVHSYYTNWLFTRPVLMRFMNDLGLTNAMVATIIGRMMSEEHRLVTSIVNDINLLLVMLTHSTNVWDRIWHHNHNDGNSTNRVTAQRSVALRESLLAETVRVDWPTLLAGDTWLNWNPDGSNSRRIPNDRPVLMLRMHLDTNRSDRDGRINFRNIIRAGTHSAVSFHGNPWGITSGNLSPNSWWTDIVMAHFGYLAENHNTSIQVRRTSGTNTAAFNPTIQFIVFPQDWNTNPKYWINELPEEPDEPDKPDDDPDDDYDEPPIE
jgi:hypothetical protein